MSSLSSHRSPLLLIGLALTLSIGLGAYAWWDHLEAERVTVAGNVSYVGERLDGMPSIEVEALVQSRAAELETQNLVISTPSGEITYPLIDVGFEYDVDVVVDSILETRHRGGLLDQLTAWLATTVDPVIIRDRFHLDTSEAERILTGEDRLEFSDPVEPSFHLTDDGFLELVPGADGTAADIGHLLSQLDEIDPIRDELRITTRPVPVPPAVTDEAATAAIDAINEATRNGVRLLVFGESASMSPAALREHVVSRIIDGELELRFNIASLQEEIEGLFPGPVGEPVNPTFEVDGEIVSVASEGTPPPICCSPTSARKIANAVLQGADGPFSMAARSQDDPEVLAWYDGSLITERVSSFTTPHNCCESRVTNIQRMADIVRGYYLVPGEVLSLNDYVGPRTREKGFVPAGAIRGGHLTPEVGGGVSQFATTIFNAAYFAGLDFLEYQAHSQYFSRYPYGREATISNPAPDLVIENTTEYPVLIWTSYTSRSITVSMYSTKNVEAEQIATRSSRRNLCTYVETDRLRTYSDGREVVDTFTAFYRPGDGLDCNGNSIPE